MTDDIILNKAEIIERCLQRIHEEYDAHKDELEINLTRQDAIILNIQRACEAAIDMAMHVVCIKHLGLPQTTREIFILLSQAKLIPDELSVRMQGMVGFRNIAVHDYKKLNLAVVRNVIETRLVDFNKLIECLLKQT